MSGRARHSVRAADSNPLPERRARSDAPYPASLARGGSLGCNELSVLFVLERQQPSLVSQPAASGAAIGYSPLRTTPKSSTQPAGLGRFSKANKVVVTFLKFLLAATIGSG